MLDRESVAFEEKATFLERPGSYPERPTRVETVETHASRVFLLDRHVYKLKKPVRRAFFDLGTIEARRRNSEEEVRLNRRLAPDVYLGTVPLTRNDRGELALGGPGEVVDWLVRMQRLPAERMLDRALADGTATADEARGVGETLAAFYASALRVPIAPEAYVERLARDVRDDAAELERADLPAGDVEGRLLAFLERRRDDVERRAREGRIVEGHGDLRPEHVWLGPPVRVIDCLEFAPELRVLDPWAELAFLALECGALGGSWFADAVHETYAARASDPAPPGLVAFYQGCRALLGAKLALWHRRDPGRRGPDHWLRKAERSRSRARELALSAL